MKKNVQNYDYESLVWMITPDIEMSDWLTQRFKKQYYAVYINDLKCGIWFEEHSAGVYGTMETKPLISSFWDFYADDIGFVATLQSTESMKEKIRAVVAFLVFFLDTLQYNGALEDLKKKVAA